MFKFFKKKKKLPDFVPNCFGEFSKRKGADVLYECNIICNEEMRGLCRLSDLKLNVKK